jgi:two-component system, OmpR family, sensor histidine kinase VicK
MPVTEQAAHFNYPFLSGGGEMGKLTRDYRWHAHALGTPETWPVQLQQLTGIMLNTPSPMLICWGTDYIQLYNDAFRPILGQNKHPRALGIPVYETYAEVWETLHPLFNSVIRGESVSFQDFKLIINRNGYPEDIYFDFSYSPITDELGNILGVLVICAETTSKVIALQDLSESEQRFRRMAEDSAILIAVADNTSNATYFSKAWVELTGRSMTDLLKFGWVDLLHPDDREGFLQLYLSAFEKREPFEAEFRVLSKNGEYRWLLSKGPPWFNGDGSFAGYISSSLDITNLKNNEYQIEQIINMLPAHVVVISGQDLVVKMINKANLTYWNRKKEEVIGHTLLDILPELIDQPFPGQLRHVLATGEMVDVKDGPVLFVNPDGSEKTTYVDYSYQPLTDTTGNITAVLVMSFEITDRVESRLLLEKYADELQTINEELLSANEEMSSTHQILQQTIAELARSESRFKFLIQGAPVAIGVLSGHNLIIESANDLILQIWGKSTEVIGLPLEEALPEIKGQPFLGLLENVYTSGKAHYGNEILAKLEHEGELKDFYLNFVYQPIAGDQGTTDIVVVATDVTEQVNARKNVERAEESLRMAIEAAGLGSYYINVIDRVFVSSPRLKEFFGFASDEELPYEAAINQIHSDYRQAAADLVEAAITTGVTFNMEYPIIGHNDGKIRWVRGIGTVQKDDHGVNRYFTGVLHEITEQKLDEIRKNDFIGMVSHELKTPLTSLNAIIQVANNKLKNSNDIFLSGAMEKANVQVKRMSNMINGFLNVSRLESGKIFIEKHIFDINQLLQEMIDESQLIVGTHQILFNGCGKLNINADRDKISSVISNLLSNAVKYSPKGEFINVTCEKNDTELKVSVQDEGMGIMEQDKDKVFERYFRVASDHTQHISGFGIGLYLSAEIIERHNGRIWVESESSKGSIFYFSLPLQS